MPTTRKPVFFKTKQTEFCLNELENDIKKTLKNDSDLLLDYPAVYMYVWRTENDLSKNTWSTYVGESSNIIQRIKEHSASSKRMESMGKEKKMAKFNSSSS